MSSDKIISTLFTILLSAFAIVSLKAIFDSDRSSIISKEGRRILSDKDRLKAVYDKMDEAEKIIKKKL